MKKKKIILNSLATLLLVAICLFFAGCSSGCSTTYKIACNHRTQNVTSDEIHIVSDTGFATERAIKSSVSVSVEFSWTVWPYSYTAQSSGAGVIWRMTASHVYIVTNYHVVLYSERPSAARSIRINVYGHEESALSIAATFVGANGNFDIAILRANRSIFPDCVEAATRADNLFIGERVIAIGNPLGMGIAVSTGIVSRPVDRLLIDRIGSTGQVTIDVIRTDVAINEGNSGGGLYNINGELLGIVFAKAADENINGFGFAIPLASVIAVANQFI